MSVVNTQCKLKYKNLDDLKSKSELKLSRHDPKKLLKSYQKHNFLGVAENYKNNGDEEEAYVTVMKLLNILSYITSSEEFQRDKIYFSMMIGKDYLSALRLAEELQNNLKSRYLAIDNINRDIPVMDVENEKDVVEKIKPVALKPTTLFKWLKYEEQSFLLIDTRSNDDFNSSHIRSDYIINVPQEIIYPGASANVVEKKMPSRHLPLWSQRATFEYVVILDYDSTQKFMDDEDSSAYLLRKILSQWDTVQYKNEINVLEGGYLAWMGAYPWLTTNPLKIMDYSTTLTKNVDLNSVDYPNFNVDMEVAKPYFDRLSKPPLSGRPTIDRGKKVAALKVYAEREPMSELLRQKELETNAALAIERDRLDYERKMQDALRKQKELGDGEEEKNEEEKANILLELEYFKNESLSKDEKIKELQERINDMKKDGQRSDEEQRIEKEIKEAKEETERLKKEREEIEKAQELERRKAEEALRLKLEKEEKERQLQEKIVSTNEIGVSKDIPQKPITPSINRSTKPKIVEKRRDFSPVHGSVKREEEQLTEENNLPGKCLRCMNPKEPGLTGLKNLGNTCYMNSILQCISNNGVLAKYFCEFHYRDDLNRSHRTRGEVAEEVAAVVRALWSGQFRSVACKDFKHTVGSLRSEYKTYEQQDSHEFLTFLMDWLHNDLKKGCTASEYGEVKSEAEKAWVTFKMRNESLISTLFYGLQKSTVTCARCGEQSATYEPFSNLSLIIPEGESTTLQSCLDLYLKTEHISGWRCPKCKEEQPAKKRTEICKLPSILVIHLKRFSYLEVHSRKRTTFVDFPLEDFKLCSSENKYLTSYSLYGVSNHYGTMEGGHYTAYCKSCELKKWYKYDDHEVIEISPGNVKTSAAYILFYNTTARNC